MGVIFCYFMVHFVNKTKWKKCTQAHKFEMNSIPNDNDMYMYF